MVLRGKKNSKNQQQGNTRNNRQARQDQASDEERFQQRGGKAKTVKRKKPVGAGKAFFLGLLASFIMVLLFAGLLVFYNAVSDKRDEKVFRTELDTAIEKVQDASSKIILAPVESDREAALNANVNLIVTRLIDGVAFQTYGSGVVMSEDGLILTNYHVVQGFSSITCVIGENEYVTTTMLGYDDKTDLAVIKIEAKELTPARLGTANDLKLGSWAMSVGNPYGLKDTLTTGCISGLGRNFSMPSGTVTVTYANMIQTDTSVREGSSGGGLYDGNGNLIGINTLINVEQAQPQTIGYAIPVDFALQIYNRIKDGKLAQHAAIGVQYGEVPEDMVRSFGLTSSKGALATAVTASGPADTAGIRANDILVKYNGQTIENAMDIYYKVWAMPPQTQVTISVLRDGKAMDFNVTLGSDVQ